MRKKKNKFVTFLFSLFPGAGHMYMGFMNKGLFYMTLCIGIFVVATFFNIGILVFPIVIVWCYAFFECMNIRALDEEAFMALEDNVYIEESWRNIVHINPEKKKLIIGGGLILLGLYILFTNTYWVFSSFLPDYITEHFYNFIDYIPRLLAAVLLVFMGLRMLKKKEEDIESIEVTASEEGEIDHDTQA